MRPYGQWDAAALDIILRDGLGRKRADQNIFNVAAWNKSRADGREQGPTKGRTKYAVTDVDLAGPGQRHARNDGESSDLRFHGPGHGNSAPKRMPHNQWAIDAQLRNGAGQKPSLGLGAFAFVLECPFVIRGNICPAMAGSIDHKDAVPRGKVVDNRRRHIPDVRTSSVDEDQIWPGHTPDEYVYFTTIDDDDLALGWKARFDAGLSEISAAIDE